MNRRGSTGRSPADGIGATAGSLGLAVRSGVDRVELQDFERVLGTGGSAFLENVFTGQELEHCAGRLDRLAARFAAKEATTKALGTGIRGVALSEIEVISDASGEPRLRLIGRAADRAASLGIVSISVSLTHTTLVAEAFVVALTRPSFLPSTFEKEGSV